MGTTTVTEQPAAFKIIGISLALVSSACIGAAFILKKRGILLAQARAKEQGKDTAGGKGHHYLTNKTWWLGMILLAVGEGSNFAAYSFAPAILVTPLGAMSVVITTILASYFLQERLNMTGKIGCMQCIFGAGIVVLNAPATNSTQTVREFWSYAGYPSFIVYLGILLVSVLWLTFWAGPRWGSKNPLVYIGVCSLTGSILVLSVQGFGSAIVYTAAGKTAENADVWVNQLLLPDFWALGAAVVVLALTMVHFLNKAINLFNTSIVTPVYYVCFTTATIISSLILFRGAGPNASTSVASIVSTVLGFLVIVGGVALLYFFNMESTAIAEPPEDQGEADVFKDMPPRPFAQSPDSSVNTLASDETEYRGSHPTQHPPRRSQYPDYAQQRQQQSLHFYQQQLRSPTSLEPSSAQIYLDGQAVEIDPRTGIPLYILPELQRKLSSATSHNLTNRSRARPPVSPIGYQGYPEEPIAYPTAAAYHAGGPPYVPPPTRTPPQARTPRDAATVRKSSEPVAEQAPPRMDTRRLSTFSPNTSESEWEDEARLGRDLIKGTTVVVPTTRAPKSKGNRSKSRTRDEGRESRRNSKVGEMDERWNRWAKSSHGGNEPDMA
ncbi:hypothetical protein HDU93_002234 [Gonapodya sp. JEL0774]|nr:hypothetical protein HDU93_002234 [Gonapodya sp. JEL0774]